MNFYYYAVFQLQLAEVLTLYYTHPAMVVGLAWICRGEAVSRPALGGMLASLAGVVVVAQPPFLTGGSDWSAQHISGGRCPGEGGGMGSVSFSSFKSSYCC